MERFEIVLEAAKGIILTVSQEERRITIRASFAEITSECTGDYTHPPIPEGWEHVEGEWNNGFVIQDSKGNQFVWVPVGFLDPNGTLDGTNFSEKFGRRNYRGNEFSDGEYNEKLDNELRKQWKSVKKYGGFYISRYNISKNKETGEAQSVKGEMPWTNINYPDAMKAAKGFGDGVSVTSHLPYGAEEDTTAEWFIKSGARTQKEIASDSTRWGNFWNTRNSPREVVKTGTREEWFTNNICDFTGNVWEWTQEKNESSYRVVRGGCCISNGCDFPAACRFYYKPNDDYYVIGFRAVLYIA